MSPAWVDSFMTLCKTRQEPCVGARNLNRIARCYVRQVSEPVQAG